MLPIRLVSIRRQTTSAYSTGANPLSQGRRKLDAEEVIVDAEIFEMSLNLNFSSLSDQARQKLSRINETIGNTIAELYIPDALVLFGSYAHGQPDEWSDVDLLIISDAFRSIPKLRRRSQFLINTGAYLQKDLNIEPLCLTPEEFRYGIQWATIEREALETGFVLLDRTGVTQVREAA